MGNVGNVNVSNASNIMPDIPVPVEDNPVLNPKPKSVLNKPNSSSKVSFGDVRVPGMFKVSGNVSGLARGNGEVSNFVAGESSGVKNSVVKDTVMVDKVAEKSNRSFCEAVSRSFGGNSNNKLHYVPPSVIGEGREVVKMDAVLEEGCKKWGNTVVGFFVGFRMNYRDLVFHLKRMWRLYQLDQVFMNQNGMCFFSFKSKDGMEQVIENGPWLVDNKPLFVKKWEPGLCMSRPEVTKVPVWVKIFDIPLEAWNVEGISRIVSRIGGPIIMDRMTTSICDKPYGRASFARVLVEIDSKKPVVNSVELWYESLGKILRLRVEHDWVPPRCEECKVFGHYRSDCKNKVNVAKSVNKDGENVKPTDTGNGNNNADIGNGNSDEGWTTVGNHRNRGNGTNVRQGNGGGYYGRRVFNGNRGGGFNAGYNSNNDASRSNNNNTNNGNVSGVNAQGVSGSFQVKRGVYVSKSNDSNTVKVGNTGTKEDNKMSEPVNGGNIGTVDDSVVLNDNGKPGDKGKSQVGQGVSGKTGIGISGNSDALKNVQKKNTANKPNNRKGNDNSNSDTGSSKVILGAKNVSTSNRFDILDHDNNSDDTELWNKVKAQVESACSSGVPILESNTQDWSDDMVKFYTDKWNDRIMRSGSPAQQLEIKIKGLSSQIVLLNRNMNNNAKFNAEKMVKSLGVTNNLSMDASYSKFYADAYKAELFKVEALLKEKRFCEVDLFLLSNKPLDEEHKDIWSDDMMDYYLARCKETMNVQVNGQISVVGGSLSVDEVEEVTTGSASFMTQNEVVNDIDSSLVQASGGPASHESIIQ